MMFRPEPTVPLVARGMDDVLFRRADGVITARRFLRDAQLLASDMPDCTHLLNLCKDRYKFAVTLAAASVRGQVSLLSSNSSPQNVRDLADRFHHVAIVGDDDAPDGHYPVHLPDDPVIGTPENPGLPATRLAAIVFTSGSTGAPVGHRKTWGALAARSRDAGACFGMGADAPPSLVGTVPAQHMYGFETTVLLPLHAPVASWCGQAFYPADIREALRASSAPRVLVTTPLQLRALLDAGTDLPPLNAIISATAPLDMALAAQAERRWRVPVHEIFGATEVGSIAVRRTTDGDIWTTYPNVRLAQPDDPIGPGVLVTAPQAEPTRLGDVVDLLDNSRFRLLGRPGDLIKLGGRRASLAGLNRILTDIAGVRDGVFVAPDDLNRRPSARLLAYVIAPDRSAEDILAALRGRLDPVFLPRRVVLVDSLPRDAVGKLPRAALASLMEAGGAMIRDD